MIHHKETTPQQRQQSAPIAITPQSDRDSYSKEEPFDIYSGRALGASLEAVNYLNEDNISQFSSTSEAKKNRGKNSTFKNSVKARKNKQHPVHESLEVNNKRDNNNINKLIKNNTSNANAKSKYRNRKNKRNGYTDKKMKSTDDMESEVSYINASDDVHALTQIQLMVKRQTSTDKIKKLNLSHRSLSDLSNIMLQNETYFNGLKEKQIECINLSNNNFHSFPKALINPSYQEMNISSNYIEIFHIPIRMTDLVLLNISCNEIKEFLSVDVLMKLPVLEKLYLHHNNITEIPVPSLDILAKHNRLEYLDLSFNSIKYIPHQISDIKSIKTLKLNYNYISKLPRSIVKMKFDHFDVTNNDLTYPPQGIADEGFTAIERYFDGMHLKSNRVSSSQYKLIVVGHETAGKTSCVRNLTQRVIHVTSGEYVDYYGKLISVDEYDPDKFKVKLIASTKIYGVLTNDICVTLSKDEIELCSNLHARGIDLKDMLDPPVSTVGIDIDLWKPSITSSLRHAPSSTQQSNQHVDGASSDHDMLPLPPEKPVLKNESSVRSGGKRTNSNSSSSKYYERNMTILSSLVLSIWDFAGQDVYHAAQEAFYSTNALYLLVWDMRKHSASDMDTYVQFWIDLIQSRAPGSDIIIVGTRSDEFSESYCGKLRHSLREHLAENEAKRIDALNSDLKSGSFPDTEQAKVHKALLKRLRYRRPKIRSIVSVSSATITGFDELTQLILRLSTPRRKVVCPFQMVNISIPQYYVDIRNIVKNLLSHVKIITIQDLNVIINNELAFEESNIVSQGKVIQHLDMNHTRDAIAFLASTGEVVWFGCQHGKVYAPFSPIRISSTNSAMISKDVKTKDAGGELDEQSHHSQSDDEEADMIEVSTSLRARLDSATSEYAVDEGDESGTWKDVTPSDTDIIISDIIFLSPHWLLNAMKRVLSHHLCEVISKIKRQVSNESPNDVGRFFENNCTTSNNNGIIKWLLIQEKLMDDVEFPVCQDMRQYVFKVLRILLERFHIIIPLVEENTTTTTTTNSDDLDKPKSERTPSQEYQTSNKFYMVPALLENSFNSSQIPQFPSAGSIKLERDFYFHEFIPPGLLQRIMAKLYSKFHQGNDYTSSNYTTEPLIRNCWKKGFYQSVTSSGKNNKHYTIDMWVWLETGDTWTTSEIPRNIPGSANGACGVLRVVGFGTFFDVQNILTHLDSFCDCISNVLYQFPGLCHISPYVLCPVCMLQQRRHEQCGEFTMKEIESAKSNNSSAIICRKYQCSVKLEQLIRAPYDTATTTTTTTTTNDNQLENAQRTINYLMEEIVRLSSTSSVELKDSVCKIGAGYILKSNLAELRNDLKTEKALDKVKVCVVDHCSGVIVNMPERNTSNLSNDKLPEHVVLTCEHVFTHPVTRLPTKQMAYGQDGFSPIFLIGYSKKKDVMGIEIVEDKWVYLAEFGVQGSHYRSRTEQIKHYNDFDRSSKIWDVCVLNIICGIDPVSIGAINGVYDVTPKRMNTENPITKLFNPISVSRHRTHVEQTLRLMSFPNMGQLCISWGRVLQHVHGGVILASFYSDKGSSGGAVVDREGQLVGILSMSHTTNQAAYVEPVIDIIKLFESNYLSREQVRANVL